MAEKNSIALWKYSIGMVRRNINTLNWNGKNFIRKKISYGLCVISVFSNTVIVQYIVGNIYIMDIPSK